MSWQACDWADSLDYDRVGPLAFRVLIKLANVAAADGSRAFRSKQQIADELGVSMRSVQRAFRELEDARLIKKGDQRIVSHMRADRRPTVYNLPIQPSKPTKDMALVEGWNGETELSTGKPTGRQKPVNGETTAVVSHMNDRTINKVPAPSTVQDTVEPQQTRCAADSADQGQHRFNQKLGVCANCWEPIATLTSPNRKEGDA